MKLLIIDDDPEFRLLISTQLRSRNIAVFGAADIIQAIGTAHEKRPDVILLDIELPGGDGFLVLERLKANKLLSTIPVIIVTVRDLKEVEEKALQAGAVASFQKPVRIDDLVTVIEQVLKHSHQTGGPQSIIVVWESQFPPGCAHFVLNSTSLQLIPALYLESRVSMMESFSQRV